MTHSTLTSAPGPLAEFTQLLRALDDARWDEVRARMEDQVSTDYETLFGVPPGQTSADDLVTQWQTMLGPLDATQHMLGAAHVEIDGDDARIDAPVRGHHMAHDLPGGETWMVAGRYDARMHRSAGRWRLSSLRLDAYGQTGNRNLLAEAGERARPTPVVEGITVEHVRLSSMGERLAGHLYRPTNTDGPMPGIVVLGSWTTVKEQMASTYAAALARRGFAALAFDPRGQGQSAGALRHVESPARKIEDVRAAAAFLARHPAIKGPTVGAVGICAGAGYVAGAATTSPAIGSVALVAPWLHDAEQVRAIYGGEDGVQQRTDAAAAAQQVYDDTGRIEYVPAVSTTDERAAMFGPFDYYLDSNRGAIDPWPNKFAVMAWPDWLDFDPHPFAPQLSQPLLLVHSEEGALPQGARRFLDNHGGPKHVHWMPGTQFDFYDNPDTVRGAVDQLDAFFRRTESADNA